MVSYLVQVFYRPAPAAFSPTKHISVINDESVKRLSDVETCCALPRPVHWTRPLLSYWGVTLDYWLKHQAPSEHSFESCTEWGETQQRKRNFFFYCHLPHWSITLYYKLVLIQSANWPFAVAISVKLSLLMWETFTNKIHSHFNTTCFGFQTEVDKSDRYWVWSL